MPEDWLTTIGLSVATVLTVAVAVVAFRRVRAAHSRRPRASERWAMICVTLITITLLAHRAITTDHSWAPLQSHVDGLLLLAALLSAMIVYLQHTNRLPGIALFATPLLAILLLWGVCASHWSFRPFDIKLIWETAHLVTIYIGAAALAAAAMSGGMFLYVQSLLRRRDAPQRTMGLLGPMASLEAIERVIIIAASVGFVFITLGLATGLIVHTHRPDAMGSGWWHAPKVVGGAIVWIIYALIMHVRFAPMFRGRRAAALSIAGFAILLIILALTVAGGCSAAHGVIHIGSDPVEPGSDPMLVADPPTALPGDNH